MRAPVAVEPVKLTLSTPGWVTMCSLASRDAVTMLMTPGGSPASSTASASRYGSSAVSGAGLSTIVDPDARQGPSFIAIMYSGTFHGMIPAATPTGARRTTTFWPMAPTRSSLHG